MAGGHRDVLVALDERTPVLIGLQLILGHHIDADGIRAEQREGAAALAVGIHAADALDIELGHRPLDTGIVGLQLVELPEPVDIGNKRVVGQPTAVGAPNEVAVGLVVENLLALLLIPAGERLVVARGEHAVQRHLQVVLGILLGPQVHDHLVAGLIRNGADALADAVDTVAQLHEHSGDDGAVGADGIGHLLGLGHDLLHEAITLGRVDPVAEGRRQALLRSLRRTGSS